MNLSGNCAPSKICCAALTAHEGRQLTTAFLKVESQLARRVIIELVEKLLQLAPGRKANRLFPRAGPATLEHRPKTARTRLVTGVRVSFPGTIRFASAHSERVCGVMSDACR